ncbi:MAG: hypothetical protein HC904_09045 [Blastochloris sp.]|nr:hypothetical protein [Blastochloris sp.]
MKPTFPRQLRPSRLPSFSLMRFESIWLEKDHLILCQSYGVFLPFMEEYRRFFFRDIQAIQVSITQRHALISTIFLIGFLVSSLILALLLLFAPAESLPFTIFSLILCLLFLLGLLIHHLKGKTCRVTLTTAVQTLSIPSLSRLSQAEYFLKNILPKIEEHQQQLSSLPPLVSAPPAAQISTPPLLHTRTTSGPGTLPPPLSRSSMTWQWMTGILLLFLAALSLLDYTLVEIWPSALLILFFGAYIIIAVTALVQIRSQSSSPALHFIGWVAAGLILPVCGLGYITLIVLTLQSPAESHDSWKLFQRYAAQGPGPGIYHLISTLLLSLSFVSVGILHLWITVRESLRLRRDLAPTTAPLP